MVHGIVGWTSHSRSWDRPKPVPAHGLRNEEGGLGKHLTADIKQLNERHCAQARTRYGNMDEEYEIAVPAGTLSYSVRETRHETV